MNYTDTEQLATGMIIIMVLMTFFCICTDVYLTGHVQSAANQRRMLIGFSGLKGAGKDTAADQLKRYGFRKASFAGLLKDIVSAAFSWDRTILEGATADARAARKQVDAFWAHKLDAPEFTPVKALQTWGTDLVRRHFDSDFWIHALFRRIDLGFFGRRVAITDVRFSNEAAEIYQHGGFICHLERGRLPLWYRQLKAYYHYRYVAGAGDRPPIPAWFAQILADEDEGRTCDMNQVYAQFPDMPHESEWRSLEFVYKHRCPIVINDGNVQDLLRQLQLHIVDA